MMYSDLHTHTTFSDGKNTPEEMVLSAIEKGAFTVSVGAYAAVLAVLGLDEDFQLVAVDEEGKEEFGRQNLQRRVRATRKRLNEDSSVRRF